MGLVQKKEEHEVIDGIEVIERSDTPDDLPKTEFDLVSGASAEDIAAGGSADEGDEPSDDDEKGKAPAGGSRLKHASKEDDTHDDGGDGGEDTPARKRSVLFGAIAVVAVIAAAIIGYVLGSGGLGGSKGAGSSSLTEDQLDTVIATYTYNGQKTDVTARELLESQYSLEALVQDDGTYPTPSADTALNYARNQILLAEADARGITVSDEEMASHAEETIGTSDFSAMAEQYNLSEEQAKEVVRQQTTLQKLYDQIVPEVNASMPTAPTEPADGDTSARSKDYADYIIGLLGDEWDSEAGTWASEDGTFYQALSGTDFTADSASYEEAMTAYYTAYQAYADQSSQASSAWTDFENELFAKAGIDLYGLLV